MSLSAATFLDGTPVDLPNEWSIDSPHGGASQGDASFRRGGPVDSPHGGASQGDASFRRGGPVDSPHGGASQGGASQGDASFRRGGPFPAKALEPLIGVPFVLPCDDPWVAESGTDSHVYLDSVRKDWADYPEYMDVLDPDSPCYELKRAARDLYLHTWRDHLDAGRVLDVGCGVGRMSMPFLDRGADVIGVDADMQSLHRYAWHAAGRAGRLDLHWSSAHRLPALGDFDLAIACEVLCYVRNADQALAAIAERLRPGGALLISMEARWGWAASVDAPADSIDTALAIDSELDADAGIVDVPGSRWVRTYEADELAGALTAAGLTVKSMTPLLYTFDGPLETCLPPDPDIEELIELEERCRVHPIWQRLNRVWAAVAIKP